MSFPDQIEESVTFIRERTGSFEPGTGIILGTGLGGLVHDIEVLCSIPYETIPHFPVATVESHKGQLLFGTLRGKPVVCMQGRFHFYEGYSMKQVTLPVRIMKKLGVENLLVSNAAGGLNPDFHVGDLMLITDHISLFMPENPLTGRHYPSFGDRFPDMCDPYDPALTALAEAIAVSNRIPVQKGVYISVPGPQLETRAEYRMIRHLGADAVGMSTVPEIIAARQMQMRCFGVSVITDMGIPETLEKAELSRILAAAARAEPGLRLLIGELITKL